MSALATRCTIAGLMLIALRGAHADSGLTIPLADAKPGPLQSPVTLARNAVEVSASQDSSNVSVQLSRGDTGRESRDDFEQGKTKTATYNAWSLILKAPVGKEDTDTELANLDGLANSFTATLKYNHTRLSRRNPTDAELTPYCDPDADAEKPDAKPPCDLGILKKRLSASDYDHVHDLFFSPNQFAWGTSATIGTQTYEFLPAASIDKTKQHRTPWSAQIFGAFERYRVGLFTVALRYENAYQDRDSGTRCPGGSTATTVDCVTDPLGPPKKNESAIASFEFRRSSVLWDWPVALSPAVNYDLRESVFGVEVPLYLWADEKGHLTGGLKAGWRNDKGGFKVGLFVGTPFSLSPGK